MSYRRRSYKGSPGTNFVRQKYQYFVDMQTRADKMQVITVTAGGVMPQMRLRPFYNAFKYFKLGKVKIRFVPAATLPVDPTGLSYEAGAQTVDPRDQMNPGLVRITNGEDVSQITSLLTGVSAEKAYYTTMLDPRWYKFQLQSGFKRTAKPLLWNVGQTAQSVSQSIVANAEYGTQGDVPSDSSSTTAELIMNWGQANSGSASVNPGLNAQFPADSNNMPWMVDYNGSALMQTNRIRMGWMPTDMFNSGLYGPNAVPEVDLITIILPKAYKTSYFYRVYIEEEVLFKDAVSFAPLVGTFTGEGEELTDLNVLNVTAMDRFVYIANQASSQGNTNWGGTPTGTNRLNGGNI